ncbi:hypothetical protein [Thiolapillus sp.]
MKSATAAAKHKWRPSLMDIMAIVAGIINLVVIGYIVGYWLLH